MTENGTTRRTLLAGVGVVSTALASGCLGSLGLGDRDYEVRVPDRPSTYDDRPIPEPPGVDPGPVAVAVLVGRREDVDRSEDRKPREVAFWNDADSARDLELTIGEGETDLFDRRVELPADGTAVVALQEPGSFRVRGAMDGRVAEFSADPSDFDCNDAATVVQFLPDDDPEVSSISTDLDCG